MLKETGLILHRINQGWSLVSETNDHPWTPTINLGLQRSSLDSNDQPL